MALHEGDGAIGKNICAVPGEALPLAIFAELRIHIGIVWHVCRLSDPSTHVDQALFKALVLRSQRVVISQVPFAENASAITRVAKHFRHGHLIRVHHRAAFVGVHYAGAEIVAPGHQARSRGRADGAHVKAVKAHAIGGKTINVGSA